MGQSSGGKRVGGDICLISAFPISALSFDPRIVDFDESGLQIFRDAPAGKVRLHFVEVRDVADVVAGSVLIYVFVIHRLPGDRGDQVEGF